MTRPRRRHLGFVNFGGAWLGLWPGTLAEQQLKVASLYYDQIIMPVNSEHFEGILDVFRQQDKLSQHTIKLLRSAWSSCDSYLPPEEMPLFKQLLFHQSDGIPRELTYRGRIMAADEAICGVGGISRRRLYEIKKMERIGYLRELNGVLASAEGGARAWLFLQSYVPCALIAFHRVDQLALTGLLREDSGAEPDMNDPTFERMESLWRPVRMYVPRVGDLPWEVVIRMRRDRRVKAFRRWLAREMQGSMMPAGDAVHYATDALWDAFGELKVGVGEEVIQGILGNMPLPIPVNPIGMAISAKDILGAIRFQRRFGWLSFLHKLDEKSRRASR